MVVTADFAPRPRGRLRTHAAPEPARWAPRQRGFSLVEVLVAVLVLSVGLLGLAGLQIAGLRSNESARTRTQVVIAAYDLADRLRAEPRSFFPLGQASAGTLGVGIDDCPIDSPTNGLERWKRAFCDLDLPPPNSGDRVGVDCGSGNACGSGNCAIIIRWNDSRAEPESATAQSGGARDARDMEFRFCTRIATAI